MIDLFQRDLMKLSLLFLSLVCVFSLSAQNEWLKYEVDESLNDSLFTQSDSVYNPMTLVFIDEYGVTHYDNIPDSNKYELSSSVIINDDKTNTIMFSEAYWQDSVLIIQIYEGTPAESKGVKIKIHGDSYQIMFEYDTPMPFERKIITNDSKFILKHYFSENQGVIYGYILLNSTITTFLESEGKESSYVQKLKIEGSFKAKIVEK